ncbi:MAG: GTP cyclohydrolase I FolE [Planctomycetes bacterium]|nr:GTP cyclohydrolase I FolE [Planctomycetota bacterium]
MDQQKIEKAIKLLLEGIGEDPNRAGLKETPQRVARMCEEIYLGINKDPKSVVKVLKSQDHDEIVLVKDIPFFSICEHHLLPFIGRAHVAYIPHSSRVTGISKLARVVEIISRRPQVQERLSTQIAEALMESLKPKGVMVVVEAEHLCMTMRGVKKPGSKIVTSVVRGLFRRNNATRAEAMALIKE